MEDATNPPRLPSNCTSPVSSDPAHDDLALHAEWSDEISDCVGDGPHRDEHEDQDIRDVQDDQEDFDQGQDGQEVQDPLLSFSGAPAPEILTGVEPHAPSASKLLSDAAMAQAAAVSSSKPNQKLVDHSIK